MPILLPDSLTSSSSSGAGVIVCRAASTININVNTQLTNGSVFGGVTLAAGDIVLVKNQTLQNQNGLYTVSSSGPAPFSTLLPAGADASGLSFFIRQGTSAQLTYQQVLSPAIVGTNSLKFEVVGKNVSKDYLRLGLDPRLSTSIPTPTIATLVPTTAYSTERIRYTNILAQNGDSIQWSSDNATLTLKANLTYKIKYRYNLFYTDAGGVSYQQLGLFNVTAGAFLKREHSRSQGTLASDFWSANHQRHQGEFVFEALVDTIIVHQHPGGWGSWASYFNTVASGAGSALNDQIISDDNYLEVEVISGSVSPTGHIIVGDVKSGYQTSDHNGWVLLDGRLKSSLVITQQSAATSLGFGTNLPDARNRMIVGSSSTKPRNSTGGLATATIALTNLPNISITGGSHNHTVIDPGHSHTVTPNYIGTTGGSSGAAPGSGAYTASNTQSINNGSTQTATTGITTGSSGALSIPLGGGGTALAIQNPYLALNIFVFLGT